MGAQDELGEHKSRSSCRRTRSKLTMLGRWLAEKCIIHCDSFEQVTISRDFTNCCVAVSFFKMAFFSVNLSISSVMLSIGRRFWKSSSKVTIRVRCRARCVAEVLCYVRLPEWWIAEKMSWFEMSKIFKDWYFNPFNRSTLLLWRAE